ncbi:hypothetical protein F511_34179 [Dorcoceras hygrometricum]|uniref:Large ribosomal subunit protein bL32m n=1 Tax=Dorcoceras hygrometricum TaxID=472368 RepID=A0A2Z7BGU9_9LAMI|nr:hypothetical protein F511_34179 [Dorcoceras hygrometricum]
MALLKTAGAKAGCALVSVRRWVHTVAQPPPLGTAITHLISPTSPPLVFPENIDDNAKKGAEELPNFPFFTGSIELMAVPKKKVSKHKKGIRNGPKALKPVPVIVRCRVCGRVKLPHFFCCSGIKPSPGEQCG